MINSSNLLAPPPPPAVGAGNWPRLARRGLKRPRGLWKARRRVDPASTSSSSGYAPHGGSPVPRTMLSPGARAHSQPSWFGSETDREEEGNKERESGLDDGEVDDDDDMTSELSGSSKRQRRESADSCGSSSSVEMWASFVDATEAALSSSTTTMTTTTPPVLSVPSPPQLEMEDASCSKEVLKLIEDMVTTSIAERASGARTKDESYEYSEWENVKGTLRRASELYDGEDLSGSITLLRAVVHECHRLLDRFPDPSVFFSQRKTRPCRRRGSSSSSSSSEDRVGSGPSSSRDITIDRMNTCTNETVDSGSDSSSSCHHHHRHRHRHSQNNRRHDSPNAFHAILGLALFLFGNLIAQNSLLAISREPTAPDFYWRAALDVFDAGDNLPSHTADDSLTTTDHPDDWRMAIAWGRTHVALAHHLTKPKGGPSSPYPPPSPSSPLSPSPQRFAPRSPLAAITAMHTPSFVHPAHASPHELLTLAADQFSRGIFHMPHTPPPPPFGFSRQSELFTLASEVLIVAERLDGAEERRKWAAWADAIFHQMHMEADVDTWRARVFAARGRCSLVIGSTRADELENALERGDRRILGSKEAEEARTALTAAISFFDRAHRSASLAGMQPLLAESLLSLANLTADEDAREALYARAKAEGGEAVARDLGPSPTSAPTADILMDES